MSSLAVYSSVISAPVLMMKMMMTVMTVMVQVSKPRQCLQLLLNNCCSVTEVDNEHPMGYNAFHTCHTSSAPQDFPATAFFSPVSL